MNAVVGIILLVIVLFAVYYMYQAGMFQPVTDTLNSILTGYNSSLGQQNPPVSPYFHQVRIRFVAVGPNIPQDEQLVLVAHPQSGGLTATGWKLKTDKGTFTIPQTYNIYSPSTPNVPPEDIFLRDGDQINFFGGTSPDGKNERVAQGEYRVWLGDFLAPEHGKVSLLDEKGVLIDEYKY